MESGDESPHYLKMEMIKRIKLVIDFFVYMFFIAALFNFGYSIYTKDVLGLIPSGFGISVFGICICISRWIGKQINEIEHEENPQV